MMINEGIRIDTNTGEVIIDLKNDRSASIPAVTIKPFMNKFSTTHGLNYFIAYKYNPNIDESVRSIINNALKNLKINQINLSELIHASIDRLKGVTNINQIDTVVVPNSSSKLLSFILSRFKNRLSKNCIFITDDFIKMKWGKIILAQDKLEKQTPELQKQILKNLEKSTNHDDWKMKGIYQLNKKFIDQFLEIVNDNTIQNLIGKNVLIIDDIKSEGTTLVAMNKLITPLAKSCIGYVFLART